MAPKKNAFFAFLKDYKNNEIKKGNKPPSLDKLADELTPVWNVRIKPKFNPLILKYFMIENIMYILKIL